METIAGSWRIQKLFLFSCSVTIMTYNVVKPSLSLAGLLPRNQGSSAKPRWVMKGSYSLSHPSAQQKCFLSSQASAKPEVLPKASAAPAPES